jgi:hypothetical protein
MVLDKGQHRDFPLAKKKEFSGKGFEIQIGLIPLLIIAMIIMAILDKLLK